MTLSYGLSFVAGFLTAISPCVLPVLPMLLGSSLQKNKLLPLYMIGGLVLSFTIVGLTLSRFGHLLGLSGESLKIVSAVLLILIGVVLVSTKLQDFITSKLSRFANFGAKRSSNLDSTKPLHAIAIGSLMGVVWSPCVGPTLGLAITLAGKEGSFSSAALTMFIYSIGAAIPMLIVAYSSRGIFLKLRGPLMNNANQTKKIFGVLVIFIGIILFFGIEKAIEAKILELLPEAWLDLITRY